MKPKDLCSPHTWEERDVLITDRVWFVPKRMEGYDHFQFPGWHQPELFGNDNPIYVEYCSGNGDWIASRAKNYPQCNWLAVEMKFDRVRKIWSKIKNLSLTNLVVVCGEAETATTHYFPKGTVSEIFINFPDPWPKKRHWKHRIIQTPFLENLWDILKPGGTITFVTDDADYSEWTISTFLSCAGFASVHPAPFFVTEMPDYGNSYFEDLWRSKGRQVRYHQFTKVEKK